MKIKIRRSVQTDLEQIYDLHTKCFSQSDHWYKFAIKNYLDRGIVIEDKENNKIIGVLLQGIITPCNVKLDSMENESMTDFTPDAKIDGYKEDIFEHTNEIGKVFFDNKNHFKPIHGIVMICVDSNFRGKGLGKKLIEKHFQDNPERVLCLNTRRSNISAYSLYKKMGYTQIAFIKNKYFNPNEDSIFMIKNMNK